MQKSGGGVRMQPDDKLVFKADWDLPEVAAEGRAHPGAPARRDRDGGEEGGVSSPLPAEDGERGDAARHPSRPLYRFGASATVGRAIAPVDALFRLHRLEEARALVRRALTRGDQRLKSPNSCGLLA